MNSRKAVWMVALALVGGLALGLLGPSLLGSKSGQEPAGMDEQSEVLDLPGTDDSSDETESRPVHRTIVQRAPEAPRPVIVVQEHETIVPVEDPDDDEAESEELDATEDAADEEPSTEAEDGSDEGSEPTFSSSCSEEHPEGCPTHPAP